MMKDASIMMMTEEGIMMMTEEDIMMKRRDDTVMMVIAGATTMMKTIGKNTEMTEKVDIKMSPVTAAIVERKMRMR